MTPRGTATRCGAHKSPAGRRRVVERDVQVSLRVRHWIKISQHQIAVYVGSGCIGTEPNSNRIGNVMMHDAAMRTPGRAGSLEHQNRIEPSGQP
eukprot:8096651-Pyramimonas_sp.AAC.1